MGRDLDNRSIDGDCLVQSLAQYKYIFNYKFFRASSALKYKYYIWSSINKIEKYSSMNISSVL